MTFSTMPSGPAEEVDVINSPRIDLCMVSMASCSVLGAIRTEKRSHAFSGPTKDRVTPVKIGSCMGNTTSV